MARRLVRSLPYREVPRLLLLKLLEDYKTLASTIPREIEWETVKACLKKNDCVCIVKLTNQSYLNEFERCTQSRASSFRYWLLRYAINSDQSSDDSDAPGSNKPDYILDSFAIPSIDLKDLVGPASPFELRSEEEETVLLFLCDFLQTDCLDTQLARLRVLGEDTKVLLKDTIFFNEPLIAYCHIKSWTFNIIILEHLEHIYLPECYSNMLRGCRIIAQHALQ